MTVFREYRFTVDDEANAVWIGLPDPPSVARTVEVGESLLADYNAGGALVGIEILSLQALRRDEVVTELRGLLGELTSGGAS